MSYLIRSQCTRERAWVLSSWDPFPPKTANFPGVTEAQPQEGCPHRKCCLGTRTLLTLVSRETHEENHTYIHASMHPYIRTSIDTRMGEHNAYGATPMAARTVHVSRAPGAFGAKAGNAPKGTGKAGTDLMTLLMQLCLSCIAFVYCMVFSFACLLVCVFVGVSVRVCFCCVVFARCQVTWPSRRSSFHFRCCARLSKGSESRTKFWPDLSLVFGSLAHDLSEFIFQARWSS